MLTYIILQFLCSEAVYIPLIALTCSIHLHEATSSLIAQHAYEVNLGQSVDFPL